MLMRWVRYWWPAAAWAGAIWLFSTDSLSSYHTSSIILPFLRWLLPGASGRLLRILHAMIRKSGHVAEYFVMSLLVLRGVRGEGRGWRWGWALATLGIVVGYAALDEVHQAFVPTRGASYVDVLIDATGASLAQCFAWWYSRRIARRTV